jgi:citrate synthase
MSNAVLTLPNGAKIDLPIINSTLGESAIDVSSLYKNSGYFTYDLGFLSTASCKSTITFIDGEKGILLHRGYKIADLCQKSNFTSLFYALLWGDLPNETEFSTFKKDLVSKMILDEEVKNVICTFSKEAHPMAIMMAGISALSAKYGENYNPYDVKKIDATAIDSVAKICTIGAFVFRYINNLDYKNFKTDLSLNFQENLVKMMFEGTESYKHLDILTSAINKILILHADHEQNASTSSVRLVASTDVNIYASMVAGFAALWGPLHGGANEAVIEMLNEIKTVNRIPEFIEKAKDKNSSFRLMGFGHRVYKNYDPRASVLKSSCDQILSSLNAGSENEILKVAKELEKIALSDDYFIQRKLFPNVDFYSGIIYKALGMQSSFFTVVFGMARSAGWASQIKESMLDAGKKISRPRQVYIGKTDGNL